MLASMEMGVRSDTWDMVKAELQIYSEFRDLSNWILEGCIGPGESLQPYIREFWKTRAKMHCVENVPMYYERTVIPKG